MNEPGSLVNGIYIWFIYLFLYSLDQKERSELFGFKRRSNKFIRHK